MIISTFIIFQILSILHVIFELFLLLLLLEIVPMVRGISFNERSQRWMITMALNM